ncbi:MAG: hypothetical protein V2A79_16320 [Planctomycetota bacterium]
MEPLTLRAGKARLTFPVPHRFQGWGTLGMGRGAVRRAAQGRHHPMRQGAAGMVGCAHPTVFVGCAHPTGVQLPDTTFSDGPSMNSIA